MKKRNALMPLFLLLPVFAVFLIRRWNEPREKEAFNRHPASLVYTSSAQCRMDCRHISKEEISEIVEKGIININKSNKNGQPCPTFALQGQTSGGDNIRVIFAQCLTETTVITCYNLDKDVACPCSGTEHKNEP